MTGVMVKIISGPSMKDSYLYPLSAIAGQSETTTFPSRSPKDKLARLHQNLDRLLQSPTTA
jgi:hypothetical protein